MLCYTVKLAVHVQPVDKLLFIANPSVKEVASYFFAQIGESCFDLLIVSQIIFCFHSIVRSD